MLLHGQTTQCQHINDKGECDCDRELASVYGVNYCTYHAYMYRPDIMTQHNYYAACLSPDVNALLNEWDSIPSNELFNVVTEVKMIRLSLQPVVQMWQQVMDKSAQAQTQQAKDAAQILRVEASAILRDAMQDAIKACKAAAEIEAMSKDRLPISAVSNVVAQITDTVRHCFAQFPDAMEQFQTIIDSDLRLPRSAAQGTLITPDLDARLMDSTIPMEPEGAEQ